ncbi:dihydrofolate reductase [Verrucomicrobiales bacterium]|jgi:dihydrofolate reductase|nr:dihydrofolate reductase [Verrucomicrobiales bacterium]MDB4730023.1 dihydrofolate reductase [bacterium]MDC0503892.1 dihydrofolate reductase [Verrucomicrobiales bacterium]MDF1788376.1 dihydrofolate reductase [Verrucomicrobiales bacterium]
MIAAMTAQRVIGTGKGIPWHLPRDQAHFRTYTAGKAMLLGRRTYEEMIGWFTTQTPIVLTRDSGRTLEGSPLVVTSVEAAIEAAQHSRASELVVSGGAQIYTAALDYADSLVLTLVDTDVEGSAQFPEFSPSENWCCSETEWYAADAENAYAMEIQRWERH